MSEISRLNLIEEDRNNKKTAVFDRSNLYRKSINQLLEYLITKYSEDTYLNDLNRDDQLKIVIDVEEFARNSLFYMKKYYNLEDDIFSKLDTLSPTSFSVENWIFLKKLLPM